MALIRVPLGRAPVRRPHSRTVRRRLFFAPFLLVVGLGALLSSREARADYVPSAVAAPEPNREFRAAWVATLKNIDWPTRPGLTVPQQKAELLEILDTASRLGLNAILLQVRSACDAIYPSNLEPWTEFLTGKMGQAPAPFYDPLAFAIEEAHRRGLELHAWFNPYRARHYAAFSPIARNHISKLRPSLVKEYAGQLWLDPGDKEVQEYSARVVFDVVDRYDIDGVHFDDYFYPYPEKDARKQPLPFPDWTTWNRYRDSGGKMARDDWRRENVNTFLRRVASGIKQRKPWVKFGISPFGIWRPGNPPGIKGLDSYEVLYADSRRWLVEGWFDYLSPQLYWPTERIDQSFPVLLKWWADHNVKNRHLWPGLSHSNGPSEVSNQIRATRRIDGTDGHIHWSMKALWQNRNGAADTLRRDVYAPPAIPPAYPWLSAARLPKPQLTAEATPEKLVRFNWSLPAPAGTNTWLWVIQRRYSSGWNTDRLGGTQSTFSLRQTESPEVVVVRAMDRFGNLGAPAAIQKGP